jgi:restriction system protein
MSAPAVWVVRAGKHGEDEELALEKGLAIVRFNEFGDLAEFDSVKAMADWFVSAHPDAPRPRAENYARQLWALKELIQVGDTIVLPLKIRYGQVAIGRVKGKYRHIKIGDEMRHTIAVDWSMPDVPRSSFRQDLLYSFGAFLTVFRVRRNNAEVRVAAVVAGGVDPGYDESDTATEPTADGVVNEVVEPRDLEEAASDQIAAFIRKRFTGHDMARLVEAILQAEGFHTILSPPGPDAGADILASNGPLGLDRPFLCVQVKATEATVDVKVFRELSGTMEHFDATQGLLVSWNGFTQAAIKEARQHSFRIRLWDQAELVRAVYRTYEKLPPGIQAELPLKRAWMLMQDEAGEGE